jgi:hypothetical protein
VWRDAAPARSRVCDQVRQFMTQRPIDFSIAENKQPRIQDHEHLLITGNACRCPKTGAPFYANFFGQLSAPDIKQQTLCRLLPPGEIRGARRNPRRDSCSAVLMK